MLGYFTLIATIILATVACSDEGNPPQEHDCYWKLTKSCSSTVKHEINGETNYLIASLFYPVLYTGRSKNESCREPDRSEFSTNQLSEFSCIRIDGVDGAVVQINGEESEYTCTFGGGRAIANSSNFDIKIYVGDTEVPVDCGDFVPILQ